MPELPHEPGSERGLLQHPAVLAGKALRPLGVVGRDQAEALVARPPRDGKRVVHAQSVEDEPEVAAGVLARRAEDGVAEHDTALDVVAVSGASSRHEAAEEGVVDPVRAADRSELAVVELPEEHLLGRDQLADA